jgi:phosphoribosylamine--glycine ligase
LKSSLVQLCLAAIDDQLDSYEINWTDKHACGVVIASAGYPESYASDHEVTIKPSDDLDMKLFHAGTRLDGDKVRTAGGRVFLRYSFR